MNPFFWLPGWPVPQGIYIPPPNPSTGGSVKVYRLGDHGPEVAAVKNFLSRKFGAYAGGLTDDDVYDQATADAVSEMQRKYAVPVTGVFEYGSQIRSGFVPKPVLFTVNGFMGDMWQQQPADTARALADYFEWQPVGYNSGAFPLGIGADSGVRELKRLIRDVYPGRKFALAGYSLGAIITGDVFDAIRFGDLKSRRDDFIGYVSWGDPRHPSDGGFEGIAGGKANLQDVDDWNYRTACNVGDIYCHNPVGEPGEPYTLVFNLVMLKWNGSIFSILDEAVDLLRRPIPEVIEIINAVVGALGFYSNQGPHMNYSIDGAVQFLRSLLHDTTGGTMTTPAPGTPQTSTKAWTAALVSLFGTFVLPLVGQLAGALPPPYGVIFAGIGAFISLLTGGATHVVSNKPK